MLRIHFSDADLAATRVASAPDPLWEITASLHRLQTRRGRWAHAAWHRAACRRLREKRLESALRELLLPLYPWAAYFPDFLTPRQSEEGLDAGLEAVLATPPGQIREEIRTLDRVVGAPAWAARLAELPMRRTLVQVLRAYHDAVIAPYGDEIRGGVEAERTARLRSLLDGGVDGLLAGLGPAMRWERPVLHVTYPVEDRDLHLDGRGLRLIPSYFNWRDPVSLADAQRPPALCYSLPRTAPEPAARPADDADRPLTALLGRARAAVLRAVAHGATTGEIARATGISASSASRHATVLRDAGLITSSRHAGGVLHTLTPAGAALLRAGTPGPPPR